jgi:hypothetical protein
VGLLDRLWSAISETLFDDMRAPGSGIEDARRRAQAMAPVVWLLGKTGAGKTAIVAALTGDPRAEIGQGFEPCTRAAAFYDVPPEAPLLRFLDTRGLGEVQYDAANDITWSEERSHLVLVVMQVADPLQHAVLDVLQQARRRHPEWPVVVAQTGLHRLYPVGMGHPQPYPYTGGSSDETDPALPHGLRQALAHQRRLFDGLHGPPPRFVRVDFTMPEDGFPPHDYGLEMFWRVLQDRGPSAIEALHRARAEAESDRIRAKARPLIYGYGTAAAGAGAGAVPIPIVGIGGLAALLAIALRTLAMRYGVTWTRSTFAQFSGAVGGGALAWWTLRADLILWVASATQPARQPVRPARAPAATVPTTGMSLSISTSCALAQLLKLSSPSRSASTVSWAMARSGSNSVKENGAVASAMASTLSQASRSRTLGTP